jgi:hypothetical protein
MNKKLTASQKNQIASMINQGYEVEFFDFASRTAMFAVTLGSVTGFMSVGPRGKVNLTWV